MKTGKSDNDKTRTETKQMKNSTTFQLKEKKFSLTDEYAIYDEENVLMYRVKGSFFSWGDNLSFEDESGKEILVIDQKQIAFLPTYIIYRAGEKIAKIKKKIGLLNQRLEIDLPKGKDYKVKGNFLDKEFEFYRGRRKVAEVSRAWFTWKDTYGLQVEEGEDYELILATVIVIDLLMQAEEEENQD